MCRTLCLRGIKNTACYKRNGFEELEDDMRIAPGKAEFSCKLMYCVLDLE